MLPIRNKCDLATLSVRSPAKLIISGEYSVLYGKTALAVAIDKYITTTISCVATPAVRFKLDEFAYDKSYDLNELKHLASNLRHNYHKYLSGELDIASVIKHPVELLQYTIASVLEQLTKELSHGLEITINSAIPVGCGMGSSAACVISVIYALNNLLQINMPDYVKLARDIENLQHGKSSGLDLHLVANGGYVKFQNGEAKSCDLSKLKLQIINTGKPSSTTGECVAKVASIFKNDLSLADEFAVITKEMDLAINKHDLSAIKSWIQQNQRLLEYIGVVPPKVVNLIRDIEGSGGAAKVCGAGALHGMGAGVVLVVSEHNLHEVVQSHSYKIEEVQIDTRGTQIV